MTVKQSLPGPTTAFGVEVLLVEDNDADAMLLQQELERTPWLQVRVTRTERIAGAIELLAKLRFDIILSDLNLPDSVGVGTFEELHTAHPEIPLIVLTGIEDSQLGARVLRGGAQDYLTKGNLPERMLGQSVRHAIQRHRVLVELDRRARQLAESESRVRNIIDSNADAVVIVSADGVVRFVNPAAEKMFHRPASKFLGHPFGFPVAGNDRGETTELDIVGPDGSAAIVGMRATEILWDGTAAFLASLRDITERVRLESQLRQAQKMEAVGRLAGGIAHDFNNLLTVIGSFAGLAVEQLDALPSVRADVEQIQQAVESAARLTSQLLAFSRRQIIQPRILDLNQEIEEMGAILKRLIGEDILLVTRFDRSLEKVKADPGQIEQILMNLAVNARDAMPRGGQLVITTTNEKLDGGFVASHPGSAPGLYAMITVTDTGQGMDEATLRSIFEPFFTTKGVGKGTGLGLATVYGIVKQSGGSIWAESEPGQGATFKIYLPAIPPRPAAPMGANARREMPCGSETILVVEDQSAIRIVAQRLLERQGYRVLVAADSVDTMKIAREYRAPIHLMVTDVVMPSANGRDLAKALVAERPDLRVIYMSGYMDDRVARHGVLDAKVAFLHKPFTQETLTRKVREVLDMEKPPAI